MRDLIVCGLGGMGSAAFYEAAQRGLDVVGIDPRPFGHDEGSSHGESRLIRQAYFEHPDYVPLLSRAYELWDRLDRRIENPVFHRTGLVIYGDHQAGSVLAKVINSAKLYEIPIEIHDHTGPDADRFAIPAGWAGVLERNAGYLEVERAITEQIRLAKQGGATTLQAGLKRWRGDDQGVEVELDNGATLLARHLVLALGPWSPASLGIDLDLRVHRVPLYWLRARDRSFTERPCFAFDTPGGFYYGFQERNGVVKIAPHSPGEETDPDTVDRGRSSAEDQAVLAFVRQYVPSLVPEIETHRICMYTMSHDEHFYVDCHPTVPGVSFAAGMSGHGYKFATVLGETLVDLAMEGTTANPIDFLRVDRRADEPPGSGPHA